GNTRGKTDGNGPWNEMNQISEFEKTHCHKHDPGHQSGNQQILISILKYYGKQNRNECSRRTRDLIAGATEQRYNQSGNNRRVNAIFGLDAGSHGKSHSKRNGYDTDSDP